MASAAYGLYLAEAASPIFSSSDSIIQTTLIHDQRTELPSMVGYVFLMLAFSELPVHGRRLAKLAVSLPLGGYFAWAFFGLLVSG